MSLNDLRRGQTATIAAITDEMLRVQMLRFGLSQGTLVRCHVHIPFGPVVLQYGGQEIALGRDIARSIPVH